MNIKVGKTYRLCVKGNSGKEGINCEVRVVSKTPRWVEGVSRGGQFVPDADEPRYTIVCRRNDNGSLITAFEDELRELK